MPRFWWGTVGLTAALLQAGCAHSTAATTASAEPAITAATNACTVLRLSQIDRALGPPSTTLAPQVVTRDQAGVAETCAYPVDQVTGSITLLVTLVPEPSGGSAALCTTGDAEQPLPVVGAKACWLPQSTTAVAAQHGYLLAIGILEPQIPTPFEAPLQQLCLEALSQLSPPAASTPSARPSAHASHSATPRSRATASGKPSPIVTGGASAGASASPSASATESRPSSTGH